MISAIVSLISELPGKVWTWLVNVVTKGCPHAVTFVTVLTNHVHTLPGNSEIKLTMAEIIISGSDSPEDHSMGTANVQQRSEHNSERGEHSCKPDRTAAR